MKSVTQRIKEIKQPRGGYINPKIFEKIQLDDENILNEEENINPGLVGMAVDYMTRYITTGDKKNAFKISLSGAEIINDIDKANKLINNINGLDDKSIISACKLCGYDVCFRAGIQYYKNVDDINPDEDTIFNVRCMIKRALSFFEQFRFRCKKWNNFYRRIYIYY